MNREDNSLLWAEIRYALDGLTPAEILEAQAAHNRQVAYLEKRYGTQWPNSIRDYFGVEPNGGQLLLPFQEKPTCNSA